MEVIGFIDHTIFRWIYFFDPSVHFLELSVSTTVPTMTRTVNEVKPAMLNEWDKTTKAPRHAAWIHDASQCGSKPALVP